MSLSKKQRIIKIAPEVAASEAAYNSAFLLLLPRKEILIIAVEIRAAFVSAFEETIHLVLIEVHKAGIALVILIVNIIYTLIAN